MASFADVLSEFYSYAADGNTTITSCDSDISHYKFYQFSLIPATVLTLLFAGTRTRRQRLLNVLNGRPGLVFPMDTLTRSSRISYCCAFGATAFLVYQILLEQKFAIDYDGPVSLKTLIAILSMFVYGIVFFPVFACLALSSAFSYGLGTLYIWMFFVVDVYKVTECNLTSKGRMLMVVRSLPSLICLAYLSISLPLRFIVCCYHRKFFVGPEKISWESLDDIKESYQGLHVRKLLRKPDIEEEPEGALNAIKRTVMNLIHQWIYHRQAGFRYPSRLISVMFVAACVVYVITVEFLVGFVELFDSMLDQLDFDLDAVGREEMPGEDPSLTDYRDVLKATHYFVFVIRTCLIVAVTAACALSFLTILHMLSSFRNNLFAMYRGDFREIPPPSEKSAVSLCTGSIKYAGFQVAYLVWAYIITSFILFLISLILAIIVILLRSGTTEWLTDKILQLWPGVVIALLLMVAQILLAKYVFLQEGGEHLRLDNRHSYFIFAYFMFFYNIFLGLVSCLLRIIKAIAIGTIFLARLDNSTLPRKFEFFDPGLSAYIGYIHMEAAHTHPVVNVFVRLLRSLSQGRKRNGKDSTVELDIMADGNSTQTKDTDLDGDVRKVPPVNVAARFNWMVVYTLLQNPQVRMYRKGYIQALKKARREGLRIPISDLPISEFDLVQLQTQKEEEKLLAKGGNKENGREGSKGVTQLLSNFRDMKTDGDSSVKGATTTEVKRENGDIKPSHKSAEGEEPAVVANGDVDLGKTEATLETPSPLPLHLPPIPPPPPPVLPPPSPLFPPLPAPPPPTPPSADQYSDTHVIVVRSSEEEGKSKDRKDMTIPATV